MPFIAVEQRPPLDKIASSLSAGELAYLVHRWAVTMPGNVPANFEHLAKAYGVLKIETSVLKERVMAYEDGKREANGDL